MSAFEAALDEAAPQSLIAMEREQRIGDARLIGRRHEQRGIAELLHGAAYPDATTGQPSPNASRGGRFSGPKKVT